MTVARRSYVLTSRTSTMIYLSFTPEHHLFSLHMSNFAHCRFEATRQIRLMEREANEKTLKEDGATEERSRKVEWHVPIVAMTADVIQATHEECLKCGMDGYVSKPFEEEQLSQAVAKFFESKPVSNSNT